MVASKAKVVQVISKRVSRSGQIVPAVLSEMLEAGLDSLSPTGVAVDLLKSLFQIGQTIGIKVNTLAGRMMSTSPECAKAMAEILYRGGHKKNNIIIWDRREAELAGAGFEIRTRGTDYLCFATDTTGVGFSNQLYSHKSVGSLVSKLQSDLCDTTINMPILKDHSLAGLSGCLKNNYGMIHNPNKYHENLCSPFQADLLALDVIGKKQKLAICDAINVQYNGGPGYMRRWAMVSNAVLLATDLVALDTVAAEIIDRLRTAGGLKKLKEAGREPQGAKIAGKEGLGCAELDYIDWIRCEI